MKSIPSQSTTQFKSSYHTIMTLPHTRRVWRRTDIYKPDSPKIELLEEPLPSPLPPTWIIIRVHAISLNWRDANIVNGGNPWPVLPTGIPGSDAVGQVIQVGDAVSSFQVGDRASPIFDQANVTGREPGRIWLAADVDGTLVDHIALDERLACKMLAYLDWAEASVLPCAGLTAWSALKGANMGDTVLIQGKSFSKSCAETWHHNLYLSQEPAASA